MTKEKEISNQELAPLVDVLSETFIQRWDLYPQQIDNGSYLSIKQSLTKNHIQRHLQGEITLGVYLLDTESQARFIVIDADADDQMTEIMEMARSLEYHGLPSYLERSRRGGHLWLFFEEPILAKDARIFGKGLLKAHDMPADIELYPKQDALKDGPGSLIRLPFGVHRKDGNRYGFISPYGPPLRHNIQDQIPLFIDPKTVSESAFDEFWHIGQPTPKTPEFEATEIGGDTLSERIKRAISVKEFIGEYIELSESGRGHCPLHDDNNQSFSVNAEKNYWHCFAGCGGGSIIDFWMRMNGDDFTTSVGKLANMLIKNE
jgi:hypothetical protein